MFNCPLFFQLDDIQFFTLEVRKQSITKPGLIMQTNFIPLFTPYHRPNVKRGLDWTSFRYDYASHVFCCIVSISIATVIDLTETTDAKGESALVPSILSPPLPYNQPGFMPFADVKNYMASQFHHDPYLYAEPGIKFHRGSRQKYWLCCTI